MDAVQAGEFDFTPRPLPESIKNSQDLVAWYTTNFQERFEKLTTLKKDEKATEKNEEDARNRVEDVFIKYKAGETSLAKAGQPLDDNALDLLKREYNAELDGLTPGQRLTRSLAIFGMFGALYLLSGFYIYARSRKQSRRKKETVRRIDLHAELKKELVSWRQQRPRGRRAPGCAGAPARTCQPGERASRTHSPVGRSSRHNRHSGGLTSPARP